MYVGGACIPEGVGFPCDSNQEKNKDGICLLGKRQNLISQLSCGVRSGQEERENRNSFSLSVGLAAVSLEDPTGQQRQEEQGERKIYKKKVRVSRTEKKWSGCVTGCLLCSKSDCFIATQGASGSRQQTMGQQDQY